MEGALDSMEKLQHENALLKQALAEADRIAGENNRVNQQVMRIVNQLQQEKNDLVKEFEKLTKEHSNCHTPDLGGSTSTQSETTPSELS